MKTLLALFCLVLLPALAAQGEDMNAASFSTMLENATLEGTWAPLTGNPGAADKPDRYRIVRAEAKGGDQWSIVWKTHHQGQVIDYPIPAVVRFAGDSAVLFLDGMPVGDGKTWSARILFQADTYVGRWWNAQGKGGTVSGTIRRDG